MKKDAVYSNVVKLSLVAVPALRAACKGFTIYYQIKLHTDQDASIHYASCSAKG